MSAPSDIVMMGAPELSAHIASRKLSCAEVMTAFLDQMDRFNPQVNAIVALQERSGLLAQARERDALAARGEIMGPLHGLPHAVKDILAVKGMPLTFGSPILKDFVPGADALPVERMRAAGAIFVGKTNTPEFALGSHTVNPVYGATRNPYDLNTSAGGSSGGAAVALALRILPLADGTDYGGSLRNPAGWNNVLGFRTSAGLVPMAGEDVWSPSISVIGPMARSAADIALLLSVMAGHDPRSPQSLPGSGTRFLASLDRDFKDARIGWLGDFGGWAPYEPGVLDVCETALKTFADLGATVESVTPAASPEQAWNTFIKIRQWQQGPNFQLHYNNPARRALLKPEAIWEVEESMKLTPFDVANASAARTRWTNAVQHLFRDYDFLVMPTAQVFAFDIAQDWPREIAGHPMRTYHEWMKANCLISLTGCPSLAVPAGFNGKGQAMGLQIIAPVQHDMACLQLAHAYEQAKNWTADVLPPLLRA